MNRRSDQPLSFNDLAQNTLCLDRLLEGIRGDKEQASEG
jgi:hypothetical protein